ERVVEPVPDQGLEILVAAGALCAEVVPLEVAPDDAAGEQHRAPHPRPLLHDLRLDTELAQACGGDQPCHPGSCDEHGARRYRSENVGLCSTYSMRTCSGPRRNTAYVFGASTTLSISTPRSFAAAMCSSAESTSTAMWLSSGRSGAPGSPGWNSTQAPPTSTRGKPDGPGAAASKPSDTYSAAVSAGLAE